MVKILVRVFVGLLILWVLWVIMEEVYAYEAYGPYRAEVVRVIDGDTVVLDVYLWIDLKKKVNLRVTGVDTPELRGKTPCEKVAAKEAKAFVEEWLKGAENITVVDVRPDMYGTRVNGHLYKGEDSLTDALIESGHGRPYTSGKRKPWCVDRS